MSKMNTRSKAARETSAQVEYPPVGVDVVAGNLSIRAVRGARQDLRQPPAPMYYHVAP